MLLKLIEQNKESDKYNDNRKTMIHAVWDHEHGGS